MDGGTPEQVHAHARSGAATPLAARLARTAGLGGSGASLREAYSMPGTPGGDSASGFAGAEAGTEGGGDGGALARSRGGSSNALLLPAGAFVRSNSRGLLGSPSGWETPLGMGPGGAEGPGMGPRAYISPEQQVQACVSSLSADLYTASA